MKIKHLNAFTDNYIWLLELSNGIFVVDPGDAKPVLDYITANDIDILGILLTHDHNDHIGGVAELLQLFPDIPVYGTCGLANNFVIENQQFNLTDKLNVSVIETPGHTLHGVCYLISFEEQKHLFCGDTLFAAGCGRVFTMDFEAMFNSLNKIKSLDKNTIIYPAHEYTIKNINFALSVDHTNINLRSRLTSEMNKLDTNKITLPTVLELELKTNPFLRTDSKVILEQLNQQTGLEIKPGLDCFIKLRELRNSF